MAEILPLESADMHYGEYRVNGEEYPVPNCDDDYIGVPCWSLAKLLELMPKNSFTGLDYDDSGGWFCQTFDCVTTVFDTPIEAAFDMICELIEIGYIKTERK